MSEKNSKPPVAEWMREAAGRLQILAAEIIARTHAEGCDPIPELIEVLKRLDDLKRCVEELVEAAIVVCNLKNAQASLRFSSPSLLAELQTAIVRLESAIERVKEL